MYQHNEKELSVTVQDASRLEVGFCFTKSLSVLTFLTHNFKAPLGLRPSQLEEEKCKEEYV